MNSLALRNVTFRVDASIQIGTGHVMRCMTLANPLTSQGARCRFICREHPGHLINLIQQSGYEVTALPGAESSTSTRGSTGHKAEFDYMTWLGADWRADAEQTRAALQGRPTDWLVVDHYAIDARWEAALKPQYSRLMVIDDLADREHVCDVLLDQNLVEGMEKRYQGKVPERCACLIGPRYALVRPEFAALRPVSLTRRNIPVLERLLIFMGGGDPGNETCQVVAGVKLAKKTWRHIDVVVGEGFPAFSALNDSLATLPSATLHVQTPDMAKLMAAADLSVTAGGSVTWEKCTLGLPSLVAILAENQRSTARMMHEQGAQRTLGAGSELMPAVYAKYLDEVQDIELSAMTDRASAICDGTGAESVVKTLESRS
jgi:UDP-2,4-diacetamido-2,4,6-trideoxy-beta-L-altropyranose hydrolase